MKKPLLKLGFIAIILMLCTLTGHQVFSQNYEIKGVIIDSTNTPLESATVVLLQASDSVMTAFTVTNAQGVFKFQSLKADKYILQMSYLGYNNRSANVELAESNPSLDLGKINLQSKNNTLKEIEITGEKIPIVIKKDTIEYNADAFKVKANADVETLLKKLPGVEVEKDGTIKAQGEEVKKILVDGKEFFGDDPKTATKNLPADAVDKVQVLDRLSEMSQFTGVDDGEREKTINLTLKEDKKNGMFGKVKAGGGTDERFAGKTNINKFNKKMQLSLIGAGNNINERNVSIRDYISFSGGIEAIMQNANGGGFRSALAGAGLFNSNQGINTNWTGGLNFNYDFSEKTELHMSYLYNNSENDLRSISDRQNFTGENIFNTEEIEDRTSNTENHSVRTRLKHEINDKQDFILRANLGYTDRNARSNELSQNFVGEDILRSQADVFNNSNGEGVDLNTSLLYRIKLAKKGRTISFQGEFGYGNNTQDDRLNSSNIAFTPSGQVDMLTNQVQNSQNDRLSYALGATYTEPIGKSGLMQFEYKRSFFRNESGRDFFDINDTGERLLNAELSTVFNTDYIYDRGGLRYVLNRKKSTLTFGVDLQNSNLDGEITDVQETISRDFFNVLPSLRWRYNIASGKSLRLNYNTSVNEPSLEQLQPILDNSNPLRLYQGNPNLKVAYRHTLRLGYYHFDQFSFVNIFANLTANYATNQITNQTLIDPINLVQTVTPVNVESDLNVTAFASFGMPLRPLKIKFDLSTNSTITRNILFVNTAENIVNRYINSVDLKVQNRNKKVFDLAVGGRLAFNQTDYSENTELNQDFLTQTLYSELNIDFLKRWNFDTSFNYDFFGGDAFQQTQSVPIWKAAVSLNFLRFNKGALELSVFDILNQNQGVNRNSSFNFIEDQRTNVLGRYFMLSFTYSLSAIGR